MMKSQRNEKPPLIAKRNRVRMRTRAKTKVTEFLVEGRELKAIKKNQCQSQLNIAPALFQ